MARDAAEGHHKPPEYINFPDDARPYWDSIMQCRAKSDWYAADLENAAMLAMAKADAMRLQSICDDDPLNDQARKHLENAVRRSIALTRLLQIQSLKQLGNACDTAARAVKQAEVAAAMAKVSETDDDLIPYH